MRVFLPLLWALAGCGAFSGPKQPLATSYVPIDDYRYFPPCGSPAYSDTLGGGEFNVYVLQDSAEVNNCLAPAHRPRTEGFPMRYGKDFVLVVELKGMPEWAMGLELSESEDMLELKLRPAKKGDGGARDQYLWHFAADKKAVLRLSGSNGRFSYAKGPAWKPGSEWHEDGQVWRK